MPNSNWSPWQPTEADLTLARMVRVDSDRAEFAFRALAGVDALVAALENSDLTTARRVVRTMRAYIAVDAEATAVETSRPAMSDVEILDELAAKVGAIADRFERVAPHAELVPLADAA